METYRLKEDKWHKDATSTVQAASFLSLMQKDGETKEVLKGDRSVTMPKIERETVAAKGAAKTKLDGIWDKVKPEKVSKIVYASITVDGDKSRGIINYRDDKGVFRQKRF